MEFNFLTHKLMGNNLIKSLVAGAVMTTSQAPADTPNIHSATPVAVRESGIDFNQNITKINTKIALIKNKIQILEEKNDLSRDERKMRITFRRELQKLTDKKHTIEINVVGNQNNHKKENLAIKTNIEQEVDKNLAIVDNRIEKKKENLAIEKEKLVALDEISRIVSN